MTVRSFALDLGKRGVIGNITLSWDEETLTEQTDTVQTAIRWRDMKGVDVVDDRVFIHVTGLSAAIIPKSGFTNEQEYEAIRDFALAKLANRAV